MQSALDSAASEDRDVIELLRTDGRERAFALLLPRYESKILGTLIGAAFAAGAAVAIAMPWARATFGPNAMLVLASIGTAAGLAIGLSSWLSRTSVRLTP